MSGEARRTATVSVLFCDLVGSTARQARLGDDAADEFRRRFYAALREAIARTDGEEVKNTGDGLMVVFRRSALDAVACAMAMHDAVGSLNADEPVQIYVGISAGEAAEEDNDWFGMPVNEAARLCAAAKPGQTLTNEVVRNLLGSRGSFAFRAVGPLTLKGLPAPVAAVEVVTRGDSETDHQRVISRSRPRRRTRVVVGFVIGVVALAIVGTIVIVARSGHSGGRPSASPINSQTLGYTPKTVTRACAPGENGGDANVICMTLIVPEDRYHPSGNSVRLPVVYVPTNNPTAPPDVSVGRSSPPGGIDLSSVADQYLLTMRGATGSQPTLTCKEERDNRKRRLGMDTRTARRLLYQELDACRARLVAQGVQLDKYGPDDVADDIRDLAVALHLTKIDVRVLGDGALPAYALARRSPSLVGALLLNSPATPNDSPFNEAQTAAAAVADYGHRCAASTTCNSIAPHFEAMVNSWYRDASAQPRSVTVSAPDASQVRVLVNGDRVMEAVWTAMHDNSAYGIIAGAVASRSARLVGVYLALNHLGLGVATPNAVDPDVRSIVWGCQKSTTSVASFLAASLDAFPQWSTLIDRDGLDRCTQWGIHPQADLVAPITGSTPALILLGDRAPEAADIERVHGELPASQLVVLSNHASGDASAWPACVPQLRRKFVLRPLQDLNAGQCRGSAPMEYVAAPSSIP